MGSGTSAMGKSFTAGLLSGSGSLGMSSVTNAMGKSFTAGLLSGSGSLGMSSVTNAMADALASSLFSAAPTTVLESTVLNPRLEGLDEDLGRRDQELSAIFGASVPTEVWAALCALLTFCWLLGAWLDWAAATGANLSWRERYSFVDDVLGIGAATALSYRSSLSLLRRHLH